MTEFAYNDKKNISTGYSRFALNRRFYSRVSYKKNVNPQSLSKTAKKNNWRTKIGDSCLPKKNSKRTKIGNSCLPKNFKRAKKLEKRHHNKSVKPKNYMPVKKVLLNSKYIKKS